ncbi:MAG: glutathione peroxidase [Candidatus Hydrogenedentes bacterium]|nr:glutathione peroxidase [Candidatus Hydrogenedentota bacterium]
MRRYAPALFALALALTVAPAFAKAPEGPLDFTVKDIDGKEINLAEKYAGKVCLVVNVASKCGLTPQYKELAAIHEKYREKGFAILAFPSNDFDAEEPGTDAEIKEFCTSTYGVKFDLFSKIPVKGEEKAPFYAYLTSKETNGDFGGEIEWNFTKFLIGRDGQVIARFKPDAKPDAPEVIQAIEDALAAEEAGDEWDDLDVGNLSGQAIL